MALSTFVFVFASLMTALLVRFPLRRAKSRFQLKELVPFFAALGFIFLGNGLFAFLALRGLRAAATTVPTVSLSGLVNLPEGASVVLLGRVSIENPVLIANYVAYTACDEETCSLRRVPAGLLIAVEDGDVILHNDDFEAVGWPSATMPPEAFESAEFLAAGEPVVVAGAKTNMGAMEADIVYAGTHMAFVARANRRTVIPALLLVLNVLGAFVSVVLPRQRWKRFEA